MGITLGIPDKKPVVQNSNGDKKPVVQNSNGDKKKPKDLQTQDAQTVDQGDGELSLEERLSGLSTIKESKYFKSDLESGVVVQASTTAVDSPIDAQQVFLMKLPKVTDKDQAELDLKSYNNIIDGLKDLNPGSASIQLDDEDLKKYEAIAEAQGITVEQAAKKDGKDVFIEEVKQGVVKTLDEEGNEIEEEVLSPIYKISSGYLNNIEYINDKQNVLKLINTNPKKINDILGTNFTSKDDYINQQYKALGTGQPIDENNWNKFAKEYDKKVYKNFLISFENKYGGIIDNAVNIIGNEYRNTKLSVPAIKYANLGISPNVIKSSLGEVERSEISESSNTFILQGDKPYKVNNQPTRQSLGVNLEKVNDVLDFFKDFIDGVEEVDAVSGGAFNDRKQAAIQNLISKYGSDGETALTEEILQDDKKLKNWYKEYSERGVDYTFENASFLYNNATGQLIYGDNKFVDDRIERAIKEGDADNFEKIENSDDLEKSLSFLIPQKDGDLEDEINTSYYNIIGLQRELLKNKQVGSGQFTDFNENVQNKSLINKPVSLNGDSFLIKKYNDEVSKLALLSQAYKLNFDPMNIEKEGLFGGAKEGFLNIFKKDVYTSDEARQDFYENYISKDPDFANDPAFSEKNVSDLYERTFTNKVGYGTPDFLKIMAEFAITKKVATGSIKSLGKLVTSLGRSYGYSKRTSAMTAAFVEELATIQGVNAGFDEEMSWMFAITGPVGKGINDFYKSFFGVEASAFKKSIANMVTKQPDIVKVASDGALKLTTSAVILKVGETPEAVLKGIKKGSLDPIAHLFDPEEFAVLMAQLQVTKGIAPIKSTIEAVANTKKQIIARKDNKKYQAAIKEATGILGISGNQITKSQRQKTINQAYSKKIKNLSVNNKFVENLEKMGFKPEDITSSNNIQDLINKLPAENTAAREQLKSVENIVDIADIKQLLELSTAKNTLLLNSEYDAFLAAEAVEGISEQSKVLEAFSSDFGKNINYDFNSIKAIGYLKSPVLIEKFLQSYGIKRDGSGKFKSDFLNQILEPGANNSYSNLSYVLTNFAELSTNNINSNSKAGRAAIKNMSQALSIQSNINRLKLDLKDDHPDATKKKQEIALLEERKEAANRSIEGNILDGRAENRIIAQDLVDKVVSEQDKLKLGGKISKVSNKQELLDYYKSKQQSNNQAIKDIDAKLESLDVESGRAKELTLQKEKLQADNNVLIAEISDVAQPGYLHKGKALELSTGNEIIFNMEDIFKGADPTTIAHELLHPFINAKIRELGISNNKEALNDFMNDFKDSLTQQQVDAVKSRLNKMGLDFEKLSDLPQGQQLEIFNAYAEAVVLGEITFEPGSAEAAKASEFLEGFIESRNGGRDVQFTNPAQAIKTIVTEYAKEMSKLSVEGQSIDAVAGLISLGEEANELDYSIQSSKVDLKTKLEQYEKELKELPAGDKRIPGLQRNISVINSMFKKTTELEVNFDIIDQSIAKEGTYDDARVSNADVRKAENSIYEIANKPGGTLFKLKNSFRFDKLDQQYSNIDKVELKRDFDAQADVYFSMALRNYIAKPVGERAPFEVYLRESVGKKFTDTLNKAKINQEQFNKRINEANQNDVVLNMSSGSIFEGEVEKEVKVEESPFKFGDEVSDARGKTLLQIYGIKETGKKFTSQIDNTIRVFMVDAIKRDMLSKREGKLEDKTESILFDNYDKVAGFIEGNSAWFRLRNFDLFYKAQLTEGGNIKRKGKIEEPQYDANIPSQKDFVDFFMARGKFAPKEGQKASNIRSQRMLKFYELIGRIDIGHSNTLLGENGGNVVINGKTINVFNNAEGYNPEGIGNFTLMQESTIQSSVEAIPENVEFENRNSFANLVESKKFQDNVKKELNEGFGYTNLLLNKYNLALSEGKTEFKFGEENFLVEDIQNHIAETAQGEVSKMVVPSKGEGRTAIAKTIEKSKNLEPEYKKLEKEFDLPKEEVDSRKAIGQEAMSQNDLQGITREEADKRKRDNEVNGFDYSTETFDKTKRKNYIKALKNIAEYGLDVTKIGGPNKWAQMYGDHSRVTGVGRIKADGTKAEKNIIELLETYPDLSIGSKNKYDFPNISEFESLAQMATLNTFLKLDPAELDKVSETGNATLDQSLNRQKVSIKNLLRKKGIDYTDPDAKQKVMEIVFNDKTNNSKSKVLLSKYLGAFDMYWSVPESELKNTWSVWTEMTKGDSQNVSGARGYVSLTFAEVNNLSHEKIWEKLEHGDAMANFNETANALIMNGKKTELIKLIAAFEGGYGSRGKFKTQDDSIGTTADLDAKGIGDFGGSPKTILPGSITSVADRLKQKANQTTETFGNTSTAKELMDATYFKLDGKIDNFTNHFSNSIQSSKQKYNNTELTNIGYEVFKNTVDQAGAGGREIVKNEIDLAIKDYEAGKITVKNNLTQVEANDVNKNAITPTQTVENAKFMDQGGEGNWSENFEIQTESGKYSYNAESNIASVPNNTGSFTPNRKVVFLAGGAGSGKGTTWSRITEQHPDLKKLKVVNSDFLREELKEEFDIPKNETTLKEDMRSLLSRLGAISVKEAKIEKQELTEAGDGYVVDGTLASYKVNRKSIDELRKQGYDVEIVYTKTDVETASKRNAARKERSIKDIFLRKNHESVDKSIKKFIADGESIIEIDGTKDYDPTKGDQVYNKLNANNKIKITPDPTVQSSKEYYEAESDRIISNRYNLAEGPMEKAEADRTARGRKGKVRLMGFKAQQAENLMLEVVGKGDKAAAEYMSKGVDLADIGRYDFGNYSSSARKDIKALNKKEVNKNIDLDKKAFKNWTRSDAVRIYLWTKNGEKIPGIKEADIFEAIDFIQKDAKLFRYANNIQKAVDKAGGDPWLKAYDGWAGTSLKFDIDRAIEQKRSTFMQPFKNWYETTFSENNKAKIKAGMGDKDFNKWNDATTDWYERAMTNRTRAKGELVGSKFINWLHGSTALALFGNRKSMFTQLLSTSNFYGAKHNNIYQAAKAYGNAEIFEMMKYILKSNYLKDRRGSYDLALKEINELESKFGDIYKKGVNVSFLLSQLGDNAAIVFGGSSMLLNNYKAKMIENPKLTREQALEEAMKDVALHSERTQQSTYASNLSYQQTKAIGKVTLNFLNTQIRYNNIALAEMKKIGKGVSKDITGSIMRVINYTGLQVAGFATLSSGLQYVLMDDELDPERKEEMTAKKKERIIEQSMYNIIDGTGIRGKATTTLLGMLDYVIENSKDKKKVDAAEFAKKSLQVSPALSIKFKKLESAGYDIQAAMKNYKDGKGWKKPAGRAATEIFSAGSNIAAPEYMYSLSDQYDFIMNERYTFWQKFGAAMGWSLYGMDSDFYKNRKMMEAEGLAAPKQNDRESFFSGDTEAKKKDRESFF